MHLLLPIVTSSWPLLYQLRQQLWQGGGVVAIHFKPFLRFLLLVTRRLSFSLVAFLSRISPLSAVFFSICLLCCVLTNFEVDKAQLVSFKLLFGCYCAFLNFSLLSVGFSRSLCFVSFLNFCLLSQSFCFLSLSQPLVICWVLFN